MPNLIKTVNFTTNKSGLSTVAYTLISTDGSTKQARTTTGVAEVATGTGIYYCLITFEAAWEGIILWDTGEATKRYAVDTYLKSNSAAEVADAVWDEDITGHTTADSAAHRLIQVFKYVRAEGFGGGKVIARNVGALTDEDKKKIFKWFDMLLARIKTLQQSTDSIHVQIAKEVNKLKDFIPTSKMLADEIQPPFQKIRKLIVVEFSTLRKSLKDQEQIQLLDQIIHNLKFAFSDLKSFSEDLAKRIEVKESIWLGLKEFIKKQNNTEEILNVFQLFFRESKLLKEQIEKNFLETKFCSQILLKEASADTLKELT